MIRECDIRVDDVERELRADDPAVSVPITWGSTTVPRCPCCRQPVDSDPLRSQGQDWHPACYLQTRRAEREAREGESRIRPYLTRTA